MKADRDLCFLHLSRTFTTNGSISLVVDSRAVQAGYADFNNHEEGSGHVSMLSRMMPNSIAVRVLALNGVSSTPLRRHIAGKRSSFVSDRGNIHNGWFKTAR